MFTVICQTANMWLSGQNNFFYKTMRFFVDHIDHRVMLFRMAIGTYKNIILCYCQTLRCHSGTHGRHITLTGKKGSCCFQAGNNIGSVFRTSDAFRIECIYLCGITATPPHAEMHKTALGAEFTVDWKYVNNTVEAVDNLKNEGYTVYSVEQAEGSIMLNELTLDKNRKYAIVMGNEVKGVQQEVIDHSHGCIEIPQYGTKHSLNVSVTAGIVIWDLFNKLK